jgi:hypothetical protein
MYRFFVPFIRNFLFSSRRSCTRIRHVPDVKVSERLEITALFKVRSTELSCDPLASVFTLLQLQFSFGKIHMVACSTIVSLPGATH